MLSLCVPAALADSGEELARTWCASCHTYPEPALLDRHLWLTSVLPEMGARLGFHDFRGRKWALGITAPDWVYPDTPVMAQSDWDKIVAFYEQTAPDALVPPTWQPREALDLFTIEMPAANLQDHPATTAVRIDAERKQILVGDGADVDLKIYDVHLDLARTIRPGGVLSRISEHPTDDFVLIVIGDDIAPSELRTGTLVTPDGTRQVRQLHRPVDARAGDFNADGTADYIVAEFGTHEGQLSLHLSQPDGNLTEQVLLAEAGAVSLDIVGADLYVLMAQGDERLVRITDFAQPTRTDETLVRFPPSFGVSHMLVQDIDGDGWTDLLISAGDNADITPVYKPYHGLYLYTGRPDGSFEETLFFPLDGASGAVAADFDGDGDTDIAAIAYYPDVRRDVDETGFVYLENTPDGFAPRKIAGLGQLGRFVAISAGDVDGDGDVDMALGNLAFGPYGPMDIASQLRADWLAGPKFVLLRNTLYE